MAIKRGNRFFCSICGKEFPNATFADAHRDSEHDIIYVPMERSDVGRLIQYIYTKDDAILPTNLIPVLREVLKKSTRIVKDEEV